MAAEWLLNRLTTLLAPGPVPRRETEESDGPIWKKTFPHIHLFQKPALSGDRGHIHPLSRVGLVGTPASSASSASSSFQALARVSHGGCTFSRARAPSTSELPALSFRFRRSRRTIPVHPSSLQSLSGRVGYHNIITISSIKGRRKQGQKKKRKGD